MAREGERRSLNAAALSSFRRIAAEITHWRHRRLNSPSAKLSTPVSPPDWSRRGPSKWSSKHHHFMQWRVISSERSLWRVVGSPLLSYQIFSHSGVWTKIFGHLSYISSPPSFDRRRRRSPRIPFCSEFCDRRPVRPRQVARSTDGRGRTDGQRHSNCHRPTGEPIPELWSGPIFFASSIGRRAGGPAAQVRH